MASFDKTFEYVQRNEGGLVDDPDDSGGITKNGISLNFLRGCGLQYDFDRNGVIDEREIHNLSIEQTKLILFENFWDSRFAHVPFQAPTNYIVDSWVNMGRQQAVRILQRALRSCSGAALKDDGILGDKTFLALENINNALVLMSALRSERAGVYRIIVSQKPEKQKFLNGWLARAYEQ